MIHPILENKYAYTPFKKDNKRIEDDYCAIGGKEARRINTELDFQRKTVEQNERMLKIVGILSIAVLVGTFLPNLKILNEVFKVKNKLMPATKRQFESLKNSTKVPTLENCKSINKDLKTVLERQLNNLKAGTEILAETGEPQAQNRMLLYGPPGVGKSFFGKIFAKSLDAEYMEVMTSDYTSMWAGEGVGNFKTIFEEILKTSQKHPEKKYVVTFNEIDAMIVSADKLSGHTKGTHWVSLLKERSVFLNYIELLKEKAPNVTVIGTTNIPISNNSLDRAAISRFQNFIEVTHPETDCLYEALKMNLNKIKNKDKFIKENENDLKELAKQMADRKFSFRNLEFTVNDAMGYHLDDSVSGKKCDFQIDYLKKAIKNIKLSDGELDGAVVT